MSSKEIREKLEKMNIEKAKLEKELIETIQAEEKERNKKLCDDIKSAIFKLWDLFWKEEENTVDLYNRVNRIDESAAGKSYLYGWIESDIKFILKKTKMAGLETIKEVTKEIPDINLPSCIEDAEIRLDFAKALKEVKKGYNLSRKISWCFDDEDLLNLMELHKRNKFRKKIEVLLEDCNFHYECGLLMDKNYEEFIKALSLETA